MFEVFYYRSNLWHHSIRVFFILNELFDSVKGLVPGFDMKKAQVLALVHDDAEMITGDVQLGHKLRMTQEQLRAVEHSEAEAITKLAETYPKEVCGYSYSDLLNNALRKDTVEAQLVSYADKLDAYCESLHEVLGGNISALRAVITYVKILKDFPYKFDALKPMFAGEKSYLNTTDFFADPWKVRKENYLNVGHPHSPETIKAKTDFVLYDRWKELVIGNLGDEGIKLLTDKVE